MNQTDEWNATHPIGTLVTVRLYNGTETDTHTAGEAHPWTDGTPVIWLRGILTRYPLDRVTPIVEEA